MTIQTEFKFNDNSRLLLNFLKAGMHMFVSYKIRGSVGKIWEVAECVFGLKECVPKSISTVISVRVEVLLMSYLNIFER